MSDFAVLLMAYGTPDSANDVESYLTDIGRGEKPSPDAVRELRERYERIGGRSPLLDITRSQAASLRSMLALHGIDTQVYFGMKHWHPYIAEVAPQVASEGYRRIIGLVLAPHHSRITIKSYRDALDNALRSFPQVQLDFIESWCDYSLFHQAVAEKVRQAATKFSSKEDVHVIFTAHSLPERMLRDNDPYPKELLSSSRAVADLMKIEPWSFAYQSASKTNEKWLGPDILEALGKLKPQSNVLIVPIGFVADNLEILYDIDVKAQLFAKAHGLNMMRTESLNASPKFIEALAHSVRMRLASEERS